jgi:hypothetical protein
MGHLLDAAAKGVYAIDADDMRELDLLLTRLEARLAQRGKVAHRAVA